MAKLVVDRTHRVVVNTIQPVKATKNTSSSTLKALRSDNPIENESENSGENSGRNTIPQETKSFEQTLRTMARKGITTKPVKPTT